MGLTVLYSGSFNPLHIGHLAILRALNARTDVERILLTVSPQNPLKETPASESSEARFLAAQQALSRHPELTKVVASDIEIHLPPPHYTIQTLDTLHTLYTGGGADAVRRTEMSSSEARESDGAGTQELRLAVGGDQLADFRRWRDYRRILLKYGLIVYPRDGFDTPALRDSLLRENPAYRITLLDAPEIKISSTLLREGKVEDVEKFLM